jgi:hypothetical protein
VRDKKAHARLSSCVGSDARQLIAAHPTESCRSHRSPASLPVWIAQPTSSRLGIVTNLTDKIALVTGSTTDCLSSTEAATAAAWSL